MVQNLLNCNITEIIYLLIYECNSFYIGKMKHMWKISDNNTANLKFPITQHILKFHNDKNTSTCLVLEHVHTKETWGNLENKSLQLENH